MKTFIKRTTTLMLALTMLLCTFAAGNTMVAKAEASYVNYSFGEEYAWTINYGTANTKYFTVKVSQRSHLFVKLQSSYDYSININIYDLDGECVSNDSATIYSKNDMSNMYYSTHSANLNAGTYNIAIQNHQSGSRPNVTFLATAEPTVSLSTPSVTAISSPSGGKFTVSYSSVTNALSYQVQFSKNTSFSSATTKENPSLKYTASGLTKGTYYYVRVRAFTVYNDGLKVYSNWSRAQSVYVKKLANTVTVSTSSKKVKYATLKKKNVTFLVVAEDKAGAPFTYSLASVPSKAKKYISVNKSTGKITVKKGLKKGTYSISVKVAAAETASYTKASTKKTIKITVA